MTATPSNLTNCNQINETGNEFLNSDTHFLTYHINKVLLMMSLLVLMMTSAVNYTTEVTRVAAG